MSDATLTAEYLEQVASSIEDALMDRGIGQRTVQVAVCSSDAKTMQEAASLLRDMESLNEKRLGEIITTLRLLADARREAAEAQALQERARTAMTMLDIASDILDDFLKHIDNSCDGDHPSREDVECWLVEYGRMNAVKATNAPTGEKTADAIRARSKK